jgi:hypothetical protein
MKKQSVENIFEGVYCEIVIGLTLELDSYIVSTIKELQRIDFQACTECGFYLRRYAIEGRANTASCGESVQ